MKIIKYIISLLEISTEKDDKVYSEDELQEFADKAKSYIIIPPVVFAYAAKAKKSKNPDIVKKAEQAETLAFFLFLPMLLVLIIGIGSWLFSGTWLALVPIAIIGYIIFQKLKK